MSILIANELLHVLWLACFFYFPCSLSCHGDATFAELKVILWKSNHYQCTLGKLQHGL